MKLFVFFVGGDALGSNIELHDFRMAVAPTMAECIPALKQQWWGIPESLHLDCWGELNHADGYDITLKPEPPLGPEKLWFLNLGGYIKTEFNELHKNVFVVAEREVQARAKALKQILDWDSHHKDTQFEVEKVINVETAAAPHGLHIHLTPNANPKPFTFGLGYKPIGKPGYVPNFGMDISVRQLGAEDWQLFRDIWLYALKSEPQIFKGAYLPDSQKSDHHWKETLADPDGAYFIISDANEPIGLTGIVKDPYFSDPTKAILWASWLKPEYRGKGLSKLLYDARLNWANQHPYFEKIIAMHQVGNTASQKALQKNGFVYTHTAPRIAPNGKEEIMDYYELNLNKAK